MTVLLHLESYWPMPSPATQRESSNNLRESHWRCRGFLELPQCTNTKGTSWTVQSDEMPLRQLAGPELFQVSWMKWIMRDTCEPPHPISTEIIETYWNIDRTWKGLVISCDKCVKVNSLSTCDSTCDSFELAMGKAPSTWHQLTNEVCNVQLRSIKIKYHELRSISAN